MHRRHRLGSASLIRRVYESGRRVRTEGLTLTSLVQDPGSAPARVAVVASRHVGSAVERNRSRRRLRAALAPLLATLRPGTVAVVAATKATRGMDFQKLVDETRMAVAKAGLVGA